jgi:hypothetical protein
MTVILGSNSQVPRLRTNPGAIPETPLNTSPKRLCEL